MPATAFFRILPLAAALVIAPLSQSFAQNEDAADIKKYKDWTVRCGPITTGDGQKQDRCVMTQLAGVGKKPMAQVEFAHEPKEGKIIAQFTTPLGTVLNSGMRLKVDEGKEGRLPYQFCINIGCRVVFPAKDEFIASMKKGKQLHMTFDLINGQTANARISLSGFTSALRAIAK